MILEIITLRDNSPFHNSPISHTLLEGRFMIGSRALQYVRITNIIENDPRTYRQEAFTTARTMSFTLRPPLTGCKR